MPSQQEPGPARERPEPPEQETERARRPATSTDVARRAGVSRATVSHVLNGQADRFTPRTVERVREAAAALGYVRSAAGRALVMGRSDFIVVVVPNTTFIRLQDIIEVLSADIESLGFTMVVHFNVPGAADAESTTAAPNGIRHLVETLRPAGVVALGGISREDASFIERSGCPVLPQEMPDDVNFWIGFLQADHLRSRGFAEIAYAFLADARDDPYGHARAGAVQHYCTVEGLGEPAVVHVPVDAVGADRVLDGLLAGARRSPVGVACYNDKVALALVFAARRRGLDVPGEFGAIGVEGADIGQVVSPRLSTVSGDVPVAVRMFRHALAHTYGRPTTGDEQVPLHLAFNVLPGETT